MAAFTLVAALLAAGCGAGRHVARPASPTAPACPLSAAQHRDVARAKREIVRMHRLEAPMTKWRPTGPANLELAVTRFLLDVGPLPADVKERLMNKGKSASALCGDCFNAIEAEEPVVQTRMGGSPCAA